MYKRTAHTKEKVLILDFGGQYNQLIARRVRECNVYCEVKPYTMSMEAIREFAPIGIIFTGGLGSVYEADSPQVDPELFHLGIPILGICYGCQLIAHNLGGQVTPAQVDSAREYGKTVTYFDTTCKLFKGLPETGISWMSHGDYMAKVPDGFALTAHSDVCPNVAISDESRGFYVDFKEIIEPLRMLFKDEVRQLGRELGLPEYLVSRQPFPGPGLAIRIIGDITKDKADTLRQADHIFREELAKAGQDKCLSQYFAVLTNTRSVGVMGDGRTYDYTLALRAVVTDDFMTAEWARIPYEVLDRISVRIVNEGKGINRICYDITSKPPATVEWE